MGAGAPGIKVEPHTAFPPPRLHGYGTRAGGGVGKTAARTGAWATAAAAVATATAAAAAPAARSRARRASKPAAGASAAKVLPKGHKPARGRGRTKQLLTMTVAQKRAEDAILREKNRQAARDFRLRRKDKIATLHKSLVHFRSLCDSQAHELATLKAEVARMRAARRT